MIARFVLLATAVLFSAAVLAQIPVEVFAGDKKASIDLMFYKYFKSKEGKNSNWLFFNRNRAVIDYTMTSNTNLPQFGFTEAISYNHKRFRGFAPVAVVQVLNRGVYPKAGIQFAKTGKNYTVFSWIVCETLSRPNLDWFFLTRYQPAINEHARLFIQIELFNSFPTAGINNYNLIQRLRAGLKLGEYQFGLGTDLSYVGRNSFTGTQNTGAFIRHEF